MSLQSKLIAWLTLPLLFGFSGQLAIASELSQAPLATPVADARIEVLKSQRKLHLFSGDQLLRSYDIGLGFEPVKDKTQEGDGATPEGDYFICVKNPQSQFYLSLGINYPNGEDADRGLKSGLISQAEHQEIKRAEKQGVRPAWNMELGGEIFIHGRGASSDWTLGCVALEDTEMKELYHATSVGTPVRIKP